MFKVPHACSLQLSTSLMQLSNNRWQLLGKSADLTTSRGNTMRSLTCALGPMTTATLVVPRKTRSSVLRSALQRCVFRASRVRDMQLFWYFCCKSLSVSLCMSRATGDLCIALDRISASGSDSGDSSVEGSPATSCFMCLCFQCLLQDQLQAPRLHEGLISFPEKTSQQGCF